MDFGTVSSWVAAGIALLSTSLTLWLQWWRSPKPRWAITGIVGAQAPSEHNPDRRELLIADIELINVGDGAAFDVHVTLDEDGDPKTAIVAGAVASGESVSLRMCIPPHYWESSTLGVGYRTIPTRWRTSSKHDRPKHLAQWLDGEIHTLQRSLTGAKRYGPQITGSAHTLLASRDREQGRD